MAKNEKVNWANSIEICESVDDFKGNIIGTLVNLIILEEEKTEPDKTLIEGWYKRMEELDDEVMNLFFGTKKEGDEYIHKLSEEFKTLLEKRATYQK